MSTAVVNAGAKRRWLERLGMAGFAFFFLKGLLWLIAPFLFYWFT